MATRKQFDAVVKTWYLNTYENMVGCLMQAELMYPTLPEADQDYAMKVILMIRGTKELCDRQREEIRARYRK